jgi:hypothetical protein
VASKARSTRPKVYRPTDEEKKALKLVEEGIAECRRWHEPFARKVERRYDAWRGLAVETVENTWRSNVQQPLLINIIEGMLSSMEDGNPTWDVYGRVLPGMGIEEALAQSENADFAQAILQHQMRVDEFALKQAPFMLQDLIAGFTVGKVSWIRQQSLRRYLDEEPGLVYDEAGGTIGIADILDEYEESVFLRDDPTFEPRDLRDWMYPEAATSVDTAPYIIDRTFVRYTTLLKMQQLGIYENVEFLKETRHDTTSQAAHVVSEREQRLRNVDRTRGLVELVDYWTDEQVITVANRSVVLRIKANPHWHGKKPFVTCSAIPDMFQIPGISVVEGLAQMQEMAWTLQNTRLDATRMAANMIKVIRGDVENSDEFEWAPNADWFVRSMDDVKILEVPTDILRATLESEALLMQGIQGTMGGLPATGGSAASSALDQKTATGMSIITNIAQAVLARRKQMYTRVFGKIGGMFLSLDQQFMRDERTIEILGPGSGRRYIEVRPKQLKGIFDVDVRWEDDAMMSQQRRAESGQLLTQAVQFAGPSAQMGVKLNIQKFWEKHLTAFGVKNPQEYFLEAEPVAAPAEQAAPGTPPGEQSLIDALTGGLPPGGVTNESLAAGPTSPSSPDSISPVLAASRAAASVGSGRSI